MKMYATIAALCLSASLLGCSSTDKSAQVSPAAVSECPADCQSACCVKVKSCGPDCTKACCNPDAAPGALGDTIKTCPLSGQNPTCPLSGKNTADNTSLGAVRDGNGCSKSRSRCSSSRKASDASLGAFGTSSCCSKSKK